MDSYSPSFAADLAHARDLLAEAAANEELSETEHVALLEIDPGKVLAKAYDIAMNGWELGGGSVRIHRAETRNRWAISSWVPSPASTADRTRSRRSIEYGTITRFLTLAHWMPR